MRVRNVATAVLSTLGLLAAGQPAAAAAPVSYYVSLGDSLAKGYQPGQGDTDQGYADALYASLKAKDRSLRLVKLGCSGETTTTMLKGGKCTYEGATGQLDAAVKFLRSHRVKYLTIDIGGNDINRCAPNGSIDIPCVIQGLGTLATNLPQIVLALRTAARPQTRLAAANYYDPYLAAWLKGADGQELARRSVILIHVINALEGGVYSLAGFKVADVAAAFQTDDFTNQETLPGVGTVPRNVARICTLTYMCVRNDIHANPDGYKLIANTLKPQLKG